VLGLAKDLGRRPDLDQAAALHHPDAVGEAAHQVQVMGDEQQRHAHLGLQLVEQARICAWMVTSSAVVGSSQISSCGRQASAMAIIARWRWPPESWCG
jgi:hypothetical protein